MNNKIQNFINKNKIIFIILIMIMVVSTYNIITSLTPKKASVTPTVPVIPTNNQLPRIVTSSIFPKQTLNFNWGNVNIDIPSSSMRYQITKPLINKTSIDTLSTTLGFSPNDLLKSKVATNQSWNNDQGSLFASTSQNQIIYSNKTSSLNNTNSVTKEEAIALSKQLLSDFFGNEFTSTLNDDPKVRFLILKENAYSPTEVSNRETAQYIEVSYNQLINSYPISSYSGNASILTLVIDNQKNLFRLEIYGGFMEITAKEDQSIVDFATLKEIAPEQAYKNSSLPDTYIESEYIDSTNINIKVNSGYFGYFQTTENGVVPVIYISGTASSNNFSAQPIVYVVTAYK